MSWFMTQLENYTLNLLTLFYRLFRFLFLVFIEKISKKYSQASFDYLDRLLHFSEKKLPFLLVYIVKFLHWLSSYIIQFFKFIFEAPSLVFSLIYEIIFYIIKSLFRIYDGFVFITFWFIKTPARSFNYFKRFSNFLILLPSAMLSISSILLIIKGSLIDTFYYLQSLVFSIPSFITFIRGIKLSDFKKVNRTSIIQFIKWFFRVKVGLDEHFRRDLRSVFKNHEFFIKCFLTGIFYLIFTEVSIFTDGFLED